MYTFAILGFVQSSLYPYQQTPVINQSLSTPFWLGNYAQNPFTLVDILL